jgi:glycosyltransferase involved in cell wall biosynthesis
MSAEERLFDVVMPYYGDVGHLKAAVRSVLGQPGHDWRLTVLDDGYPDPEVATWFHRLDDPRVRYLRNERNLGANANYVQGLQLARAPYLVMMGADDLMLPDYLGHLRESVTLHPDAAVFQPGVRIIDGDGAPANPAADRVKRWSRPGASDACVTLRGERMATTLLRANWTYFPSLCWRTDLVKELGFRPGLNVVQDLALLVDVALSGGTLVSTGVTTFAYRRHAQSDSAVRALSGDRFREEARFFEETARRCVERGWQSAARAARMHLTSRLHAASLLPRAARARDADAFGALLRHAVAS